MTDGELEKFSSKLEGEVDELKSTLEDVQKADKEKLTKLESQLKARKGMKEKKLSDSKAAEQSRSKAKSDLKAEISDIQAEIEETTEGISAHKTMLKDIQESINLRMVDVKQCGCKIDSSLLTRLTQPKRKTNYDLVFKIEKLEREKADLGKAITAEQGKFGEKSRALMDQVHGVQIKMDNEASSNRKYKENDETMLEAVISQRDSVQRSLETKQAQLTRLESDAKKAQDHYDNLEAEMKHCGCEPPSDTVLEMRKFQMDNR